MFYNWRTSLVYNLVFVNILGLQPYSGLVTYGLCSFEPAYDNLPLIYLFLLLCCICWDIGLFSSTDDGQRRSNRIGEERRTQKKKQI